MYKIRRTTKSSSKQSTAVQPTPERSFAPAGNWQRRTWKRDCKWRRHREKRRPASRRRRSRSEWMYVYFWTKKRKKKLSTYAVCNATPTSAVLPTNTCINFTARADVRIHLRLYVHSTPGVRKGRKQVYFGGSCIISGTISTNTNVSKPSLYFEAAAHATSHLRFGGRPYSSLHFFSKASARPTPRVLMYISTTSRAVSTSTLAPCHNHQTTKPHERGVRQNPNGKQATHAATAQQPAQHTNTHTTEAAHSWRANHLPAVPG